MISRVTKQEDNYGRKVTAEPPPCTGRCPQVDGYTKTSSANCRVWSSSDVCPPSTHIRTEPENPYRCSAGTSVTQKWCDLERVPISEMGLMIPLPAPHRVVLKILQIAKHLLMYYYSPATVLTIIVFNPKSLIPLAATPKVSTGEIFQGENMPTN